jgi:hypothetical protein
VAALAVFGAAAPAAASDRYLSAEREAARGRLLVRIGKLSEGVAALERAHAVSPDPRYRLEIGKAYEGAGQLPAAIAAYDRFLADGVGEVRVWDAVRKHRDDLRTRLSETHGEVLLTATPPAAEVYLDEVRPEARVQVPLRTWLPVGEHALIVQEPGFLPTKLSFSVSPGAALQTVDVALAAEQEDGRLVVRANRREAIVYIDGRERCRTPCEQALPPGTYLVRVEAPGDLPIQQLVRVRAAQEVPLDAMLKPGTGRYVPPRISEPVAEVAPQPQPQPQPQATPEQVGEVQPTPEQPRPERIVETPTDDFPAEPIVRKPRPSGPGMSAMEIAGWSCLGGGLAIAGAGGYFTWAALDKAGEANGLDATRPDYLERFDSLKSDVELSSTLSIVMYSVGGAAAAAGAALLVLDALSSDGGGSAGAATVLPVSAAPVPGGAMVQGGFRF